MFSRYCCQHRFPVMNRLLTIALLAAPLLIARAEEPPPPASLSDQENQLEPEVTIKEEPSRSVHEYRINGRLYMVKIVPKAGPPYYLMDLDGDGEMDAQEEDPRKIVVPQWVLFRW